MKKKDIFFANLFTVTFLICGMIIAGDYLYKNLEGFLNNSYIVAYAREKLYEDQGPKKTEESYEIPNITDEDMKESIISTQPDISVKEEDCADQPDEKYTDENAEDVAKVQEPEEKKDIEDKIPELKDTEDQLTEKTVSEEQESEEDWNPEEKLNENEQGVSEAEVVGNEYFDDALFIGDSRTVGIMEYGDIGNATFFADSGMSVFDLEKKSVSVPGTGKVSFDEVLEKEQYGKIYLMLGINELGYRFESIEAKYKETVEKIRLSQPDAVIYVCANMHVTVDQSKKDAIYNNENVNRVNEMIAGIADNESTFYIDVNELFDDAQGGLSTEYSSDSFHVLGRYYMDWVDWLCTKAVPQPERS